MKKMLLSILTLSIISVNAQTFEWAKGMGGTSYDKGKSIDVDDSGNIYTTGSFSDTVDFDPNAGTATFISNGMEDIFIQKVDASGNLLWNKIMGGYSTDLGESIKVDGAGNILITGTFRNTVDFDPNAGTTNLTAAGSHDIFIQKLDSAGNLIWVKSVGGSDLDQVYSITNDVYNNIYITGSFRGISDFDPGTGTTNLTSNGNHDTFIMKLDVNGNLVWAKSIGGNDNDIGYSIQPDAMGNLYVSGSYAVTVDFDPGSGTSNLTSNGGYDVYVMKLDASGNLIWAKSVGGTNNEFSTAIATDGAGNIFVSGYYGSVADFDPGVDTFNLNTNGNKDIFILKLTANGNFAWAQGIGGTADDFAYDLVKDNFDNIFCVGAFKNTVDFDPGTGTNNVTSTGNYDAFILKLDTAGNFAWVTNTGGIAIDYAYGIAVDDSHNVFTTGYFGDVADFDHGSGTSNLTSQGYSDIFVHKLSRSNVGVRDVTIRENIQLFPNPTNNLLTINTKEQLLGLIILDMTGKEIKSFKGNKRTIEVSELESGMYFLQAQTSEQISIHKFIKQ